MTLRGVRSQRDHGILLEGHRLMLDQRWKPINHIIARIELPEPPSRRRCLQQANDREAKWFC